MRKMIVAVILSCGAVPVSAQTAPPADAPADAPAADILETVRQMRAELMRPGPRVENWEGGADPSAALRARGAGRHVLQTEDENGTSVSLLTDRRLADVAPKTWRIVDTYGSAIAYAENPGLGLVPLGRRFVVGTRSGQWRDHGLDCGKGFTHAILFERPDAADTKEDVDTAIGLFRLTMLAMEDETLCTRAEGDSEKGWQIRVVLPDGRDLPAFNEGRRLMRIVPVAPLETLVKGKPLPEVPPPGEN